LRLSGKVALVTGASRGIGQAIARGLAAEGAALVLAARSVGDLEAVAGQIGAQGGRALVAPCDVRLAGEVQRTVSGALKKFGRLDILVNNAGVAFRVPLAEMAEADFDLTLAVNLKGIFLFCRQAVPVMAAQGSGTIINISSGAGKQGFPELAAYCATKFAVIGLSESLALEVAGQGIRVFSVCPGATDTQMYRSLFPEEEPELAPEHIARRVVELCLPGSLTPSGASVEVYYPFSL
jgi:NAD(P)-dependent dehydrogenase (short-subunit alcohol dehydrogenase family)